MTVSQNRSSKLVMSVRAPPLGGDLAAYQKDEKEASETNNGPRGYGILSTQQI